ncbi:MAG TPA: hypothetical protein VGE52_16685, partial [Pirellulales bacterium]
VVSTAPFTTSELANYFKAANVSVRGYVRVVRSGDPLPALDDALDPVESPSSPGSSEAADVNVEELIAGLSEVRGRVRKLLKRRPEKARKLHQMLEEIEQACVLDDARLRLAARESLGRIRRWTEKHADEAQPEEAPATPPATDSETPVAAPRELRARLKAAGARLADLSPGPKPLLAMFQTARRAALEGDAETSAATLRDLELALDELAPIEADETPESRRDRLIASLEAALDSAKRGWRKFEKSVRGHERVATDSRRPNILFRLDAREAEFKALRVAIRKLVGGALQEREKSAQAAAVRALGWLADAEDFADLEQTVFGSFKLTTPLRRALAEIRNSPDAGPSQDRVA